MIATEKHHKNKKPLCPYCHSPDVRELGKEGTEKHRHVCLASDCIEVAAMRLQKEKERLNIR